MIKKHIQNGLLLAIMLTGLGACKKDFINLTDPNSIPVNEYFKSENDVRQAVNGIYNSLRSANTVGENSGLFSDERSDDTGRNDNQSNAGEPFQFNDFSILPGNTYLKTHWASMYECITRANFVLNNIDKVSYSSDAAKNQYTAEAKYLRAMIYFEMVQKWGDIPFITESLTNSDQVGKYVFREKKEKVYTQIVADLKDAAASQLPNIQDASGKGRVCKAAANALLGQVYLTMAAMPDQSARTENLNNAKTYLTAAYGMRSFGLLKEIPYADVFDVTKKTTNAEIIFQIVNKQGDINFSSSIAANNQAEGETINSLKKTSGVGGNVTPDLVKDYETGDARKDFSIKFANNAKVKDYFITKFRDNSSGAGSSGYGGNDWILMRYADVILMLAEVNMQLGDNASAIGFLNQVRERAGLPNYAVSMTNPAYSAKYPTLKLAILHERRAELAFEHKRWFDLLRFFTTDELVAYFKAKNQADFGNARLANFNAKDRYYPIPFDEYKLDPQKMYQNPGY